MNERTLKLSLTPRFSGVTEPPPDITTVSMVSRDGVVVENGAEHETVKTVLFRVRLAISSLKRCVNDRCIAGTATNNTLRQFAIANGL